MLPGLTRWFWAPSFLSITFFTDHSIHLIILCNEVHKFLSTYFVIAEMKINFFFLFCLYIYFFDLLTCVYLNCCSTSLITVWQSRQTNVPVINSGCTGWVRTTWPLILNRLPILWLVNSRILQENSNKQCMSLELQQPLILLIDFCNDIIHTYLCLVGKSMKLT